MKTADITLYIIAFVLFILGIWPIAFLLLFVAVGIMLFSNNTENKRLKKENEELKKEINMLKGSYTTAAYEEPIKSRRSS